MVIVRDCMFPNIAVLSPATTLMEAVRNTVGQKAGFAVVLERTALMGIVTEYDLLKWIAQGKPLATTTLAQLPLSQPHVVSEGDTCQDVLKVYHQRRLRRFPVINADGVLAGGIMERQLLESLPRSNLLAHYRVANLVHTPPPAVPPEMTYLEAVKKAVTWHRGCIMVSMGEKLLGLITDNDLLRARIRGDWQPEMRVDGFMTTNVVTMDPNQTLLYALDTFRQSGWRRFPVVEQTAGRLVGLLTQTDLLKQMAHSVKSHQAVLNPEDINEPAIWFETGPGHRILAMNQKGAQALGLDMDHAVGAPVAEFSDDPALWDAIAVLLTHCGSLGPIRLSLRTGGGKVCVGCRFSLIHTPTGENRIFWTLCGLDKDGQRCL